MRLDLLLMIHTFIQRMVLTTEETTVTQQVSDIPIKCQSRLWSNLIDKEFLNLADEVGFEVEKLDKPTKCCRSIPTAG